MPAAMSHDPAQIDATTVPGGKTFPPARWLDGLVSVFAHLGIATLIIAIVLTCADIAWRRLVGGAFVDTADLTKFCLVVAASWSIPYGFTTGAHVTVDLLTARFADKAQALLEVLISLATAVLLAFLLWLAWQGAMLHVRYGDTSPNLQIPLIYYWSVFLLGLVLSVLAALANMVEALLSIRNGGVR